VASDSFTGTNGTHLADHDANWLSTTGAIDNITIQSNALNLAAWVLAGAYWNGSSADDSQLIHLANTSAIVNVIVRAASGSNGYAWGMAESSGGNYTAGYILKNGAWVASRSGTWAINQNHTIRVTASGTSPVVITPYVDGTALATYSDSSSPITSGHPGILLGENGGSAVTCADDWTDGASAATPVTVSDTGTGADALSQILAALHIAETGHGNEASPSPRARVPLAESGHGGDSLKQVLAALHLAESGHGADALAQILASLVIADTGQGEDAINLPSGDFKTVGDDGSGADTVVGVSVVIPISDSGRGLDLSGLINAILAVADSGRGVDAAIRYVPTGAKRIIVTFSKKSPSASFGGKSASASFALKKPGADFEN